MRKQNQLTKTQTSSTQPTAAIEEIRTLHFQIVGLARTSLEKAIRVGELLTEIKSQLNHGEWLPWIKTNLPFTDRTARNYIRLHENRDRLKLETVSDLTTAYKLLSEPEWLSDIHAAPPTATELATDKTFIPEDGCMLLCNRHDGENSEVLWVVQSASNPGYYFIALVYHDPTGAHVNGSKKAIHADYVTRFVMLLPWLPHAQTAKDLCHSLDCHNYEHEGWKYNEVLFTSYEDYLEKALGIPSKLTGGGTRKDANAER
jgi:hypothetical protein